MKIRNPRTGAFDYLLKVDQENEIKEKTNSVRSAQVNWASKGIEFRLTILNKWLAQLQSKAPQIIEQLAIDTGRTSITKIEVGNTIGLLHSWMARGPQLMNIPKERSSFTAPSVQIQQEWVPYAVVGVISPWNFPMLLALIDTIPALLAGCGVLLKPSEVTPRFMDPLEESILAVPELADVFKILRGGANVGKAVVNHADAICFTGSVPTGKKIAAVCADRFIPAFLELGGKDPSIVFADADIEQATDAILCSCLGATGQACQSLERIYVEESIAPEFIEKLVQKANLIKLSVHKHEGQMGPLIFIDQAEKINVQIQEAIEKGAKLLTGGKIEYHGGGTWIRPTILVGVNHSMQIMMEETFGPVIPIMTFATDDEAVQLANDTIYGLSASVFSADLTRATAVASQLEAGAISINDGSLTNQVYDAEKHSFKASGINGSRMGDAGFTRFFRKKAILIQTGKPRTMKAYDEGLEN